MSVATISPAELNNLLKSGEEFDLIDVREPFEFQSVHVTKARNIPLNQVNPNDIISKRTVGANKSLYIICHSGSRGRQACEKFIAAGFTDVINVDGGTQACEAQGLPVTRGKKIMSLERQVRIAAGSLVLTGVGLGTFYHHYFLGLAAFVGAGLIFAGITDTCGMGLMLAKMPWNQNRSAAGGSCATS